MNEKVIKPYSIYDNSFFSAVMSDEKAAEYILRLCTGIPDLEVMSCDIKDDEASFVNVAAQDNEGLKYNIMFQTFNSAEDFNSKRSRYYQSAMDLPLNCTETEYDKLHEVYLIFLTPFNPLKSRDRHSVIYKRESYLNGVEWDNGVHELYINSEKTDGTLLSDMIQYLANAVPDNDRFGALSAAVKSMKP